MLKNGQRYFRLKILVPILNKIIDNVLCYNYFEKLFLRKVLVVWDIAFHHFAAFADTRIILPQLVTFT